MDWPQGRPLRVDTAGLAQMNDVTIVMPLAIAGVTLADVVT